MVHRAHTEHTPLARFLDQWDGGLAAPAAYVGLDRHLRAYRQRVIGRVTP